MNKRYSLITILLMLVIAVLPLSVPAGEQVIYLHPDALGSPAAASDASGNLLWQENYRPYGDRVKNIDSGANDQWYSGKVFDEETQLSYFGARYYDPVVGRFMGIDPQVFKEENFHSFNRYAYANNNPYKFVDPDGEVVVPVLIWGAGALAFLNDIFFPAPVELDAHNDAPLGGVSTFPGPLGPSGKVAKEGVDLLSKGAKQIKDAPIKQVNPRNLIPTQTRNQMSGSQIKRLVKDMKKNGFDQTKPVDAIRNPTTRRLELQDGHHRTEAARRAGLGKIPVRISE